MRRLLLLATAALVGATATAQEVQTGEEIAPPHVYQAVRKLSLDIELIREVMGKPRLAAPPWIVEDAVPRHVFYQAQVLFRKTGRLAQELAGEESVLPPIPQGVIEPRHVLQAVHAAQERIDRVRTELGIGYAAELPDLERSRRPRDVLRETVQASRQLNLMLDRPIAPSDVYGRLELAAAYVAGALTEDESAPVYGTLPPFDPGKLPQDVYRRVLECLAIAQDIGRQRSIDVLELNLNRELRRRDISPSDVYHLATTLLAELAHLTLELDAKDVDLPPVERPKHIFPSHVYRMAGMLQDELARLEALQ